MITLREYIDSRFKMVEDTINKSAKFETTLEPVNLVDESIDTNERTDNGAEKARGIVKVNTSDTLTDPNNRYITDKQIEEFTNKIGKVEFESAIKELNNNFKLLLAQQLDNIINDKDSINAINNIKKVISENEETLDLFKSLISIEELEDHINSGIHITDADRVALNLLLSFIDKGCADWDADETQPNYIRNKPKALPANGGNADTVGGLCASKLINKQPENYIIGVDGVNTYGLNRVNLLLNKDNMDKLSEYLKEDTAVAIREGEYNPKVLQINNGCNLSGIGYGTRFNNSIVNIRHDSSTEDITFTDCKFDISGGGIRLKNCNFYKCDFDINSINMCMITGCRFINCTFNSNSIFNTIITNNIFNNGELSYIGGNNILNNNVII